MGKALLFVMLLVVCCKPMIPKDNSVPKIRVPPISQRRL